MPHEGLLECAVLAALDIQTARPNAKYRQICAILLTNHSIVPTTTSVFLLNR